MISLFSARMKCSFSGVRMHKENFCPVRLSPSTTSVHWFMLMVPCGRVVGCKGKEEGETLRREEQRSAELSPKTSPGGHQDPTHQDALPTDNQMHQCAMPSAQQSSVPYIWGHRPTSTTPTTPVWSTAASEVLLLCQISRDGWLPCCGTWTPRKGTKWPALGLQLQAIWAGGVAPGDRDGKAARSYCPQHRMAQG